MTTISLSVLQQKIVQYDTGSLLVKAGAGSGKTRVLTERIKRLCRKSKRKILAITFTNKAAEEIRSRLAELDNTELSKLTVGTFHAFCQQVLETHGTHIGFANVPHIFDDESDRLKLVEQAIEQIPVFWNTYRAQDVKKQRDTAYAVLNFISETKRRLQPDDSLLESESNSDHVFLYHAYQDILTSQNAIDYDDLILLTYNLFTSNPKIAGLYRRTYEFICIDEAQDLNYAQYQMLRSMTGEEHNNVMMVGDPNQSIFAFAGSSAKYMNDMFYEDYAPTIIELNENYRSSKSVLKAAQSIIPDSCDLVNTVIEGIFEVHQLATEEEEAEWIAGKISELIALKSHPDIEGNLAFENIAVLARNRYVFKQLIETLSSYNMPFYYKITPGAIKFESKLMKLFDLALRVKINPKDSLHWHRLLDYFKCNDIKDLNEIVLLNDIDEVYKSVIMTIINLKLDGSNFKKNVKELELKFKEPTIFDDENEHAMVLNDISALLAHWHQYSKKTHNESLQQFKNSMALGKTNPLSQPNGVTLSTVHTMKGQEYDIVFLMGMDDETFPDYRAVRTNGAELEQERNNAYVAFTRAKRFLYVTWPQKRLMPWNDYKVRKISRFLKNLQ